MDSLFWKIVWFVIMAIAVPITICGVVAVFQMTIDEYKRRFEKYTQYHWYDWLAPAIVTFLAIVLIMLFVYATFNCVL